MRIIAGEFRGRRLLGPATDTTRPITDRVKQSLFDILSPLIAGASVYDCFAGTGSMGLESLSRGAASAVFFEMDRSALMFLKKNIAALGVAESSTIVPVDLFKWAGRPSDLPKADLIFFDPPYRFLTERSGELQTVAGALAACMAPAATCIFRHAADDHLDLAGLSPYGTRTYGGMTLDFLKRP